MDDDDDEEAKTKNERASTTLAFIPDPAMRVRGHTIPMGLWVNLQKFRGITRDIMASPRNAMFKTEAKNS